MKKGLLYLITLFFCTKTNAQHTKNSTASKNVYTIDTAFYIPQLDRHRRIVIYLPHNYTTTNQKYPVLYLQDGQNIFDNTTSFIKEWGVDECVDTLIQKGVKASIIVAIDNGGEHRMYEYNPYVHEKYGGGEGDKYVDFLSNTLKPYIDKNYRTLTDATNTTIAGSSMGALISYYAAIKKPEVFGNAGIFSASFWIAPQMLNFTDSVAHNVSGKFYFSFGSLEGEEHVENMNNMVYHLALKSKAIIYSTVIENENHNEENWRKQFADFYKWIIADGYNFVIKVDD